jgi:hypothetical protein
MKPASLHFVEMPQDLHGDGALAADELEGA